MKVTVCFGNIRVVVPCGLGDILVRDLIREATLRYKKATGKGPDSWVAVHNLQSQGGGILDPDDRLNDVADDREQILASFEDGDGIHHHGGGDGASGSSVGTGSPDIFHDGDHKYSSYPRTDIEVTGEQIASGVPNSLQVRRGSEPTLNQLPVGPPTPQDPTKRWSAAPLILEPPNISGYDININDSWNDSKEEEEYGLKRITRDGNRLSMQFFEDGAGYKWQDAAEKAKTKIHTSTSLPREAKRKEPLGQANSAGSPSPPSDLSELVVIRNEPGPLGIHVVPDYDRLGHNKGLLVQNIEPGGRIDRDGRLAIFDRIIEINGQHLINMPFQRVQEIFKSSLTSPELRMKVVKSNGLEHSRKHISKSSDVKEIMSMVEGEQKHLGSAKVATVSPTKKLPAVSKNLKTLLSSNVRTIGKKFKIELLKGRNGLGFSITTRDNPAGGNCPIYIKNIFPKGAAEEDGRLQIGDRLLIVNDVEITGKTQEEAAAVLRNAPPEVTLIVSRQVASEEIVEKENNPDLPNLPRLIDDAPLVKSTEATTNGDNPPNIPPLPQSHLQALQNNRSPDKGSVAKIISQFQDANISSPPDKVEDSTIFPWKHREILTFNIKVHYSEKAGLGIMVKGKINGNQDSGIFIKNVINGGAASRDRRLRTNDQLLNVNGISLLRQSNRDAMDTLENAMMYTKGPVPEHITLMIARRASSPSANRRFAKRSNPNLLNTSGGAELSSNESDPSGNNHSGTSDGSTNTVIYNPYCVEPPQQRHGLSPIQTWNPVIDRLTGNNDSNSNKQLRNESYYKATHDTWTNSMMANNSFGNVTTTTLNMGNNNEPILIEDEYGSRVLNHQNSRINIHMSNKMNLPNGTLNGSIPENRNDHEPDGRASQSNNQSDNKSTESSQITIPGTDVTYASQLSLENPQGFSRDAFGRQSMSEKRHATLDAKSTDTYQKSKKMREMRGKDKDYADKLGQLGPSLGMKKSSSLESLQTMVQEIQMKEEGDPAYTYRGPSNGLKVIRGRGCEVSFRAAVDNNIDPNHPSEGGAKKHWLLDPPTDTERENDGFTNTRGGPRQSSLNAAQHSKNTKKKPGILKGIGSMFRFGKHRKTEAPTAPVEPQYHTSNEFDNNSAPPLPSSNQAAASGEAEPVAPSTDANHNDRLQQEQIYQQVIHGPAQAPNMPKVPIQKSPSAHSLNPAAAHIPSSHHVQKSPQQNVNQQQQQRSYLHQHQHSNPQTQREMIQHREHREPIYQRHGYVHRHAEHVQVIPENSVAPPPKYRNNNDSQRRTDRKTHEQRMAMRHSYYPSDSEREPIYEQRQRQDSSSSNGNSFGRPGSRSGITESSVPFTHYVNYNDLQTHLSRKQHQYHSQRQTRTDNQLRPVSNFYEYESVSSLLNTKMRPQNNMATPHMMPSVAQQNGPPPYQDANSNLTRQPQNSLQNSRRGPFVTHVTIGEHKQQQNGTKV